MFLDEISPVMSGVMGGGLAICLSWAWARWLAKGYEGRSAAILLSESRSLCWVASTIFMIGLLLNVAVYPMGIFRSDDWRGLGVVTGCTMNLILLWMWFWSGMRDKSFAEAFVTFAIYQKAPTIALSGLFIGAEILFAIAGVDLFLNGR